MQRPRSSPVSSFWGRVERLLSLTCGILPVWAAASASALTITQGHIALLPGVSQSVGTGCSGCEFAQLQGPLPFSDTLTVSASTPEYVVYATSEADGSGSVSPSQFLSVSLSISLDATAPPAGPGPGSANQLVALGEAIFDGTFELSTPTVVSVLGSTSGVSDGVLVWGTGSQLFYGFGTQLLPAGSYDIFVDLTGSVSAQSCAGCAGESNQFQGRIDFTLVPEPSSLALLVSGLAALGLARARRV